MAIKRYVEGQGWVEIANSTSSSGKAINVSIADTDEQYESSNVEGALNEIAYNIKSTKSSINSIKSIIEEHLENHPSGGGDSPGGGVLPTIKSDFEITSSDGKSDITIPIFFTSPNLGEGTAYILVRNIEIKTQQVQQGNNEIIVPPIGAGTNIPISIYVKDRAGMVSNQLTWVVTAGGIELKMITDTKSDFSIDNKIALAYTISCVSTETIYTNFIFKGFDLTNNIEVEKEEQFKSIAGYNSFQVTGLGVGKYKVEYWAESGPYATPHQFLTLVIVDKNKVLISTDFEIDKEYESGIPISIPYRVSIDKDEDFTVDLYINGNLQKSIITRPSYLYWAISSLDIGTHTMRIHAHNDTLGLSGELEFECKVVQGEYTRITPVVDASLLCWFDATEKTNNDSDRDIWTDKINGNVGRLYNFNYGSNGWIREEGSTVSELVMDGTAYVEIDMQPFKDNFKNGATIELVFKSRDVGNDAARILDITDTIAPYKGVYVDTREAYIATASQTTNASVGEDEYIHVMYQIDRTNKYAHVIINGVITKSCKLSDSGTGTSAILESVAHNQKVYLNSLKGTDLFGSCEVKHLRIYERTLTFDEILQNYLSTIEDIARQKAKSDFNNPLKNIMPIMNITCDPAILKQMTDTNKVEVAMTYTSPNSELYGQTLTDATKCLMYWQGTSSVAYNIKNYNIVLRDSNGQDIMYSPYKNCIPQSLFCLKANLMESTNAHNVGLADYVRTYLYDNQNPAQKADPRASRTIQGFPILLYINKKLIGVYDFNLDRYSTSAFGYDLPAHKNTCKVYEISANTNTTAGAFVPWTAATGADEWTWYKNDFSGIYPPEIQTSTNDDFAELKELINFVHNSNDEVFITNFSTYFDKESVIRYYIMVMVLGLVDSLGKNAKLVTYDGVKWYFEFYDMDTAMGLDNTGALKHDVDIEVNSDKFNTADSVLWSRVRTLFHADIVAEYKNMRNKNLTLDKIYECLFTNQIEKIPESQYNLSTQAKYLDTGEYIMMSNGNRYYNLKRWIKERLIYCDTLFEYTPTTASYITVRSGVEGSAYLDIETYYPMYITVEWRNQADGSGRQTLKIERNTTVRFEGTVQAKDQEVLVYGAAHLKRVSGMDGIKPRHLLLNNAYRLTSVECPNNTELISVQLEKCSYLQRVDLSGCSSLGTLSTSQVLDVSGCNNLRYLNAYGTIVTSINVNQAGGNLVELYVPKTLQTLSLINQYSLKVIGIPGAQTLDESRVHTIKQYSSNISDFYLKNCPLVERLTYNTDFSVSGSFFDNYANERKANEIKRLDYPTGEWQNLMSWGNGLANCNSIYIENSCYNVSNMSFRGISSLNSLTLRSMPYLKTLMLGANCSGYRTNIEPTYYANKYDVYSEFDWNEGLIIRDCPAIKEFRIHEMYPYGWSESYSGNLSFFTFKPGTDVLNLAEKFPNLEIFECNCATQNIHQIILPQSLKSIITCAWNEKHDEGFNNEVKIDKFNIDSIFFEGERDNSFEGIDLGNHELVNTRIIAPYAKSISGINITNTYVNPIFNDLKESGNQDRPFITPNGKIDVSGFKWKEVSDWFAFIDFTKGECEIITPDDWDKFLKGITKAQRIFYHCTNPEFTWEFAMKFFPKVNSAKDLNAMYQYAKLANQKDFDTDGVIMNNDKNIGTYNDGKPFFGTNLKYIKEFNMSGSRGAYGIFQECTSLIEVGDCNFTGTRDNNYGISNFFAGCSSLKKIGNITSTINRESEEVMSMEGTFKNCANLASVGYIDINTNNINYLYSNCRTINKDNISLPNTKNTTSAEYAFNNCVELTGITFDTLENLIYANGMFYGAAKLASIHLTGITEDSPLQQIESMFSQCKLLTEITLDGETLPKEIRSMSYAFSTCTSLKKLPVLPEFSYDTIMNSCCAKCHALTDETMYKEIPFKVISINNMYSECAGLIEPVLNINADKISATRTFEKCPNITTLTANFNGNVLKDSVRFSDGCGKLETVNFKFPNALVMHTDYYKTGTTYYRMFQNCQNLKVVNLDMSSLANSNTKADFGEMFKGDNYIQEIHGLDFTYLKKPDKKYVSSVGSGYDLHDPSITAGASYENLNVFDITGLLSSSYDFEDITKLSHTISILNHLDTVTNETLGLTYNIGDILENENMEGVDPELKAAAERAEEKGWTFALI